MVSTNGYSSGGGSGKAYKEDQEVDDLFIRHQEEGNPGVSGLDFVSSRRLRSTELKILEGRSQRSRGKQERPPGGFRTLQGKI